MLLDVARPAIAEQLRAIDRDLQRLLDVLAAPGEHGGNAALDAAEWPYQRPPGLCEAVHSIAALHAEDRVALAEAYRHDVSFAEAYESDAFAFSFAALSPSAHVAAHALLRHLYERIFVRRGFVAAGVVLAQRKAFVRAFLDANPGLRVCPACTLLPLSDPAGGSSLVDVDHVLPRSRYPQLIVHPDNLVPVCKPCNARKRDRDPLDGGGSALPLTACYLPYLRTALSELAIDFHVTRPDERTVRIGASGRDAARRVEVLDRLLSLSERLSDTLETAHVALMKALALRFGADPRPEAVRAELLARAVEADALLTVVPGKLVESAWARWLADDGLASVMSELDRARREAG